QLPKRKLQRHAPTFFVLSFDFPLDGSRQGQGRIEYNVHGLALGEIVGPDQEGQDVFADYLLGWIPENVRRPAAERLDDPLAGDGDNAVADGFHDGAQARLTGGLGRKGPVQVAYGRLQSVRHGVETGAERPNLVVAFDRNTRGEIAGAEFLNGDGKL